VKKIGTENIKALYSFSSATPEASDLLPLLLELEQHPESLEEEEP